RPQGSAAGVGRAGRGDARHQRRRHPRRGTTADAGLVGPAAMQVGVLALQGDFAAHGAALAVLGAEARWVRRAADLEGLPGLVLPGGESTTMLKLLAQEGFTAPVREFA